MNMQSLMAQAQKVQRELQKTNEEIENTVFTATSGAVKIEMSGKMQVNKIEITDDSVLSDKDMLEDMLLVAFNDVLNQVAKTKEEKMGKYTGGLGGLF